ncbi:hypothetical protein ACFXP7_05255 [Microbacterium sp. P06]|uniref:hypothetical protein n=1 Tax=Microbacterium sp. P06 TaxID=3366949 RepID=UPI0037461DE1
MSAITIRSGSVVEVDTESLRRMAQALSAVVRDAGALVARVATAADLAAEAQPTAFAAVLEATVLRSALERGEREGEEIVQGVRAAAALYEAVELYLQRDAAAAAGDEARVDRMDARLARLAALNPGAVVEGRRALDDAPAGHGDLYGQAFLGAQSLGAWGPWLAFPAVFGIVDALRYGTVPAGARLTPGSDVDVRVRTVSTGPAAPPATLAAAAQRIPSGGDAQVRVERYAMPDGTRQFGVYVAGTQTGGGASEPFDNRSNISLYGGERSASYAAVTAALHNAGAREGDVVHGFGHSQGAMVLERLALEGTYDTRTVVSFGSPVQADVGADTFSVSLRHTDDPVAALQSGGHPAGVGAPGSFVVERLDNPSAGLHDLKIPAHSMASYTETAAMVDASADPRAATLREIFDALGTAESAEVTEYAAERLVPGRGGGGAR